MSIRSFNSEQNLLTRLTPRMVQDFTEAGHWGRGTIYNLAKVHATRDPDRIAIRDSGLALSYGHLFSLAEGVAGRMAEQGLRPGDRVAAWMSSRCELAVLLVACAQAGFVLCPSLHRNHTVAEVAALFKRMRAKAIFVEAGFGADGQQNDIVSAVGSENELALAVLLQPVAQRTTADLKDVLVAGTDSRVDRIDQPTDIVYLAFTSGTTGEPKGVLHSSNTLLANACAIADDWNFEPSSVIYTLGPLSHNLGFGALVLTLAVGCELVVHDLPRGAELVARLDEVEATFLFGVPAHAMDLLKALEASGVESKTLMGRLKGFRISGAAVPGWVVERMTALNIKAQSGYGMTEACSHHYTLPDDPIERITSTSGRSCPGYEVKVFSVDNPDHVVSAEEIGHIGGRGASLMMGYFDDQAATEHAFNSDGWFMTGDLGKLDEHGYLTLTGRLKEIIIRGGQNIHPAKIEQLAMRYPGVERAAALGISDERLGERVCLLVMPKKNYTIDPQSLLAHLDHSGLSKYDMPEYFLEVSEIPLSAAGKMLKRALVPAINAGIIKPQPIRFSGVN